MSSSGGSHPRWNPNGKELFFIASDGKLMTAPVRTAGGGFATDAPQALFQTQVAVAAGGLQGIVNNYNMYGVAPDGQRFVMIVAPQDRESAPVTIVLNWQALLRK